MKKDKKKVLREKTQQLRRIQQNDVIDNTDEIKRLDEEICTLLEGDNINWRQCAKKNWYQLGEKSSKYFHSCATQRQRRNRINAITNDQGQTVLEWDEIEVVFNTYYQNMFRTSSPTKDQIDKCVNQVKQCVTPAIN